MAWPICSSPFSSPTMFGSFSIPRKSNKGDGLLAMAPLMSPIDPNGSNFVFSPLSLRAMLSLIAAGASDPALKQLLSILKSGSVHDLHRLSSQLVSTVLADASDTGGPTIGFANGLWVDQGVSLKSSFKEVVRNVYKADLRHADFFNKGREIESEVNSWANEKTNGLIRDVLPPGSIKPIDMLVFANALYFKGTWGDNYFKASNTKDYDFHLLGGDSVKVPFMSSDLSIHSFKAYDEFKVLRLPYKQGHSQKTRFSMYILLPHSVDDGLASLTERIVKVPGFLDKYLSVDNGVFVKVLIPKFKISFECRASKTLKQLGVTLPFEMGGLTKMVDSVAHSDLLAVSEIYQKSFVEVNEEGTKAAAFCAYSCAPTSPATRTVNEFVADHPFIFLIREDDSGALLFFGHVLNPLKG